MQAIRYRSGLDARTGRLIRGQIHLAQSVALIWTTRVGERIMLLGFGSDLRSHLSEDVNPALALALYDDMAQSIIDWEPEYRMVDFQLVSLTRKGGLGIRHAGLYYPEGRYGNYTFVERFGTVSDLASYEGLALASSGRLH